ncbi:TVP38/TMEM64 family protein [Fictibacillus phosphorivorans]|uniref:TVP38/TMEM64 family membrane protein n=1 Tax=Fictibacillus phosphorivorans TaxID=1221500 RepID=A0A160INY3_9BACL|nr:VTT domain-containing protein [Fictibacillus phosphorivorans]ANC78098.1 alkaline phosphatase [Fictibacillus phosphorivorans]MQR95337.1 TVP38/TMEM64 family protein [Fictibacillus phosphorivorans]
MLDNDSVFIEVLKFSGIFAPLLFILLQAFRQFFFLPVGLICLTGGILFGAVAGAFYSVIGITLSSVLFYWGMKSMPKLMKKVKKLQKKWIGKRMPFSIGQIAILKMIPFMHFHLLSLCLIEISSNFKEYTKASIISNVPIAILYSSFGSVLFSLSLVTSAAILVGLSVLFYLLRRKEWVIKWSEFFEEEKEEHHKQRMPA